MGIRVVWDDNAKSIIRWDFEDPWTWDDFRAAFKQSVDMAADLGYRVDIIPNATQIKQLPIGALGEFKRTQANSPENTGLVVITGGNMMTNTIIQTFSKVNRIDQWRTARSLDEARAMIMRDREKDN